MWLLSPGRGPGVCIPAESCTGRVGGCLKVDNGIFSIPLSGTSLYSCTRESTPKLYLLFSSSRHSVQPRLCIISFKQVKFVIHIKSNHYWVSGRLLYFSQQTSTLISMAETLTYSEVEGEAKTLLDQLFGLEGCLIEVNPGRVLLPPKYKDLGHRIKNMQVRPDDVWLVSLPRTGSTWAQEMVWCIGNDVDLEAAKQMSYLRNPLLELTALVGNDAGSWKDILGNSVDLVESLPSPRYVKTHLPLELLPTQIDTVKPKMIYVSRNPKDMCVSYYHYSKLLHDLKGSFQDFCHLLLQGKTPVGPVWNHIMGFWNRRHLPNVLFLKYEDMKKDQRGTITEVATFLGKSLTDEQMERLLDHLSFESMRRNPSVNLETILKMKKGQSFEQSGDETFIRKGQVGDWANYMSPQLSDRFDAWMEENLRGSGLSFQTTTKHLTLTSTLDPKQPVVSL